MKCKKINTINMNQRDFSITRKEGEWYDVRVIDSYGKVYQNYFEKSDEANDWVYYIWEKEEWFNSVNSQELLANAFKYCNILDKNINVREI
tara:strand:- start:125 stop:397 length:273 start_codon:yes stop_codon:yes gene_type:complete